MRVDLDRRDVRHVDGLFELADPLRLVERQARRRDDDLRREQAVAACSAGWRGRRGRRGAAGPCDHDQTTSRTMTPTTTASKPVTHHVEASAAGAGCCMPENGKLCRRRSRQVRAASSSRVACARPSSVPHRPADHVLPADRQSRHSSISSTTAFRRSTPAGCRRRARSSPTRCSHPKNDTTIGLTIAGAMTPAGLGGCVIEMMERGLVDFVISTGANLYHDLHYALNFTLHRGSPFLDDRELYADGRHPHLRRALSGDGAARDRPYIRDFLMQIRHDRPGLHVGVPLPARSGPDHAAARVRGILGRGARRRRSACRSTRRRPATARSG